jgi:hypothetical protein
VVYASVFSPTGTLITTLTVATGYAVTSNNQVSVCTTSSGKFAVTYQATTTSLVTVLYSTSYVVLATSTWNSVVNAATSYLPISSAGLSNDRFVVCFFTGANQPTFQVYDNTNTVIAGPTVVQAVGVNGMYVVANNWGGFTVQYYYGAGTVLSYFTYYNTTGNTYAQAQSSSFSANSYSKPSFSFANGMYYSTNYDTVPANYLVAGSDLLSSILVSSVGITATYNLQSLGGGVIGVTGFGNPVLFYPSATGLSPVSLISWNNNYPANFTSAPNTYPNNSTLSISSYSFQTTSGFGLNAAITSGVGNNIVLAWCDTNGYLNYAIANVMPVSASTSLVAGTTSSNGISLSPVTSSSTSSAIGGVFTGVAVNTAAAGSSGQVITNGTAQLNANYTNTASGAFDSTGPGLNGVRGTYSGRIINIQGNS